jgi:hypothetical protein
VNKKHYSRDEELNPVYFLPTNEVNRVFGS